MRKVVYIALFSLSLSACTTTGLYDWGNYEDALFDYYHQPETKDDMVSELIAHLEKQVAKGSRPAPGLFAEAGTFYLLDGKADMAITYYKKEAEYWPESQAVMSRLISNLEGK